MKSFLPFSVAVSLFATQAATAANYAPPQKDLGFPVYKNKPAGKQVSGQHAPASTPALSPEEAQQKFTLPPGFEIRLFASEPEVVNPVAMTWDERGRLWVVELYEYPLGAKPGEKPRDRIKILEDTDADGRADKVTVFADGMSLATGIALGYGGVYVGQAPELLFLEDTNAPTRSAGSFTKANKRTVLLNGFGLEDRHELLNGFTWGPDGWLYLTHGVFTHSKVKIPEASEPGVTVNAAVARFHPRTKKFEVFADGTSNPWGVDFDRYGNAFVSACVIDHLFHMAPGGIYVRQGGTPANPYSYQLLPSIVDHRHHMAAYAGVQVYQGDQYPAEYRGTIMMGNIHDNAVHQDVLTPNGTTFKASFKQDFVRANDGWFMPVSQQVGPDGALWIMDWYDKYPCYQNARADPDGVDREHGRIWRVVYTGKDKGKVVASRWQANLDLKKTSAAELVKLLEHPNIWQRKMVQRLLSEQPDPTTQLSLVKVVKEGNTLEARLAALWTLHSSSLLDDETLNKLAADKEPGVRLWVARFTGERSDTNGLASERLQKLAADPNPSVRLAVAVACRQMVSGELTVNKPVPDGFAAFDTGTVLETLARQPRTALDPLLPFMIWQAGEQRVAADPSGALAWFNEHGEEILPMASLMIYKTMRRICDLQKPEHMDAAVDFLTQTRADGPLASFALNGLVDGQKGKAIAPTKPTDDLFKRLLASPRADTVKWAQQLGTAWGNTAAIQVSINQVSDANLSLDGRLKAVQSVRQLKTDAARDALLKVIAPGTAEALMLEAVRALGEIGSDATGNELISRWNILSPAVRRAAAEALASRARWASMLLSALEQKTIPASDITATAIRTLTRSDADFGMLAKRATLVFGKVRDADKDKFKLITAKRKMILDGTKPDLKAGHELAQKTCFTCHKLHGEGADIGPDLTGVGRSSLDALLANIIDPNQIIGAGYEMVEVETKDGRSVSGRMVENTDSRVKLLSVGPKEDVVAKSDIERMRVSELSVMPEGLEQMSDGDFRNLIAYLLNPPGDKQPFSWRSDDAAARPAAKK